jgi:cardiolipin synthase (CMP-forming)
MTGVQGLSAEPSLAMKGVPLYDTDRVWTLPNVLSFLRLAGVPLMLWLILGPQADGLAVLVLALGGITDWLDGYLARAWHQTSRIGQMLDPIADRLYILAVLIGLALREIVPWWLFVIVVGRDVLIALLVPVLKTRGYSSLPVHFLGKAATFSLLYAFPLVLLGSGQQGWLQLAWVIGWAFAIWGTALYWYAGGLYLAQTVRLLRSTPPIHDRRRSGVTR